MAVGEHGKLCGLYDLLYVCSWSIQNVKAFRRIRGTYVNFWRMGSLNEKQKRSVAVVVFM